MYSKSKHVQIIYDNYKYRHIEQIYEMNPQDVPTRRWGVSNSPLGDWAHPCIALKLPLRIGCLLVVFFSPVRLKLWARLLKTVRLCVSKLLPHRASARLMSGQPAEDQSDAAPSLTGKFQMLHGTRRFTMRPPVMTFPDGRRSRRLPVDITRRVTYNNLSYILYIWLFFFSK